MVHFHIISSFGKDFIYRDDHWDCAEYNAHFEEITCSVVRKTSDDDYDMKNGLIMGYKTFQKRGYFANRYNFVIDRDSTITSENFVFEENVLHYHIQTLKDALEICHRDYRLSLFIQGVYIIGGISTFAEFFEKHMYDYYIQRMYITKMVNMDVGANVGEGTDGIKRFPFHLAFKKTVSHNNVNADKHTKLIYNDCWHLHSVRKSDDSGHEYRIYHGLDHLGYNFESDERNYLQLIHDLLHEGVDCDDRTGVGTLSTFGAQIRFSLAGGTLPLLTTKKMFTRGVVEELLWFLRGETDSKILEAKGVNIWKGNTSREALDKRGLTNYPEGEGGPIYGHQFRNFGGAKGGDGKSGVDQVEEVLYLLREDPNSRRMVINLWNPCDLDKMALPPCHMVYQFRVYGNKLSCSMYQRSCDTFLGLPFNICSTALMTYIFAKLTGLVPHEIVISIGDAHIYKNHVEQVKKQLKRAPYCFPKLQIKNRGQKCVEDFKAEDFIVLGYESHEAISAPMAV